MKSDAQFRKPRSAKRKAERLALVLRQLLSFDLSPKNPELEALFSRVKQQAKVVLEEMK